MLKKRKKKNQIATENNKGCPRARILFRLPRDAGLPERGIASKSRWVAIVKDGRITSGKRKASAGRRKEEDLAMGLSLSLARSLSECCPAVTLFRWLVPFPAYLLLPVRFLFLPPHLSLSLSLYLTLFSFSLSLSSPPSFLSRLLQIFLLSPSSRYWAASSVARGECLWVPL